MSPHTYVLCSFGLTFGVPMAAALREYWITGPSAGHLPPGEPVAPMPHPLPDAGARPALLAQRPLPACLIPNPGPARVRELA